jgi:branched-chain amino acid transport system substrate-binding protein
MRIARSLTLAGVVALVATSPGVVAANASARPARQQLVIGSLAPETGEYASVVESLRAPVKMAVDEVNQAGGVGRGGMLKLVTADEGIESQSVVSATKHLIDVEHAHAIMGPAASSSALAILDTVANAALVCSGSNTAAILTKEGPRRTGGLYFRTSPPDRLQGPALAELVLSDGRSNIGLVSADDLSSAPMATAVAHALVDGGAKVTRATVEARGDPAAAVQRVLRVKPDAVVVVARAADGARVVETLITQGHGPGTLPIYGNDGLYDPGFAKDVDPSNPGVVAGLEGTVPASDPAGTDTAFDKTFAATGIDPFFSSYYYDCTILTALAAVKARSDDPKKMASVFASNLEGKNDCATFAACKALLQHGRSIHYRGASSRFDRWDTSEPAEGTYDVWSYDPGAVAVLDGPDSQITIP